MTEGSDMILFKPVAVRLEKNHLLVINFIVMWTALYTIGKTGACLC
jgi:hypothetical protein